MAGAGSVPSPLHQYSLFAVLAPDVISPGGALRS